MTGITTHVLDVARGVPAAGVEVRLERAAAAGGWHLLAVAPTDAEGRVRAWPGHPDAVEGLHRLTFATGVYFEALGVRPFFPEVGVVFDVRDRSQHHHVPLLLSPFGYSTYRGA